MVSVLKWNILSKLTVKFSICNSRVTFFLWIRIMFNSKVNTYVKALVSYVKAQYFPPFSKIKCTVLTCVARCWHWTNIFHVLVCFGILFYWLYAFSKSEKVFIIDSGTPTNCSVFQDAVLYSFLKKWIEVNSSFTYW